MCQLHFARFGKTFEDFFHLERSFDYLMKQRLRALPDESKWREAISATRTRVEPKKASSIGMGPEKLTPWPTSLEGMFRQMERGLKPKYALSYHGLTLDEAEYLYEVYRRKDWGDVWAGEIISRLRLPSGVQEGIKKRWSGATGEKA